MTAYCIRWKKTGELCTVTMANALAIFPTRKEALAFRVHGAKVVPIALPDK
jgi:hypothetical protein